LEAVQKSSNARLNNPFSILSTLPGLSTRKRNQQFENPCAKIGICPLIVCRAIGSKAPWQVPRSAAGESFFPIIR
jgi:hypothetical protein